MSPVTGRSLPAVVPGVGGRGSAVRSPATAPLTPNRGGLPAAHRHRCLLRPHVFLPAPLLLVDVPVVLCPEIRQKTPIKICYKMKGIFTYCFSLTRVNKKNNQIKLKRFSFTLETKVYLMRLHDDKMDSQWRIQDCVKGGDQLQKGVHKQFLVTFFAKNCVKMKEFGPSGRRDVSLDSPWDPPLGGMSLDSPWDPPLEGGCP